MTSETPESLDKRQRRRYDPAFKRAIVEQTLVPGASVARIAREHGINANQLFKWRRQYLLAAQDAQSISLLPVTVVADEPVPTALTSPAPGADTGQIEITLASGTVRVQGAVDTATLQQMLSSLRQ